MRRTTVAVVTAVLVLAVAGPASAGPGEDVLRPGERLGPGQALLAPAGGDVLVVQPDGALGLYALDDQVRWSTGRGVPGATLTTDATGDVLLVAPDGAVLWSTATGGSGGTLRLRDDGDVVVEDPDGGVVWSSGTGRAPAVLDAPGRLDDGDLLSSPDGRHTLLVDGDGGVQLRGPDSSVRWAPGGADAAAQPTVALELRADGDLVARGADGGAVWRSRTAGRGAVTLVVQDDGDLVLLDDEDEPVWRAGTAIGPSTLDPGAVLGEGASLGSPSGHLGVSVTGGALVATWRGRPFWSSPAAAARTLQVSDDGDLLLLDGAGAPVWSTATGGRAGARLVLEETAVLLVAPRGEVLWQVAVPAELVAATPAPAVPPPTDCALVDAPVAEADVVRSRSGIRVHPCLAGSLDALVAAARADGVVLGGGGWRSSAQQVALRRAHCGPTDAEVFDVPASACSPSTARPGSSRHERGLAVDFTVGGRTVSAGSPAYAWLVEHAGAYGLRNLPSEPWHWSVDGR
ncbi:D-alanyl-D-alanine carboxypeptidase family protein [Cellulomonas phragmiteti]|uniref:D-alanyl-D-alanine carboxypeptidase family protein n=1 Tax=Cellulomonas phragmiteti TaxID=478780 RepID=UPI001940C540|nr:D-alanyl-D-alanine carboxypeptidase family protein [Cellulomonas phragmiteti]